MDKASDAGASGPQPQARRPVLIVKLNDTPDDLARRRGELADWIGRGLRLPAGMPAVVDPRGGAELPDPRCLAGVVVTGSPAMVTDCEEWSQRTAGWLRDAVAARVPVLGICYGHQLLAHAMGGHVDYNPNGRRFGTVEVRLLPEAANDSLLSHLPPVFLAQASHSQSVLRLPDGAVPLAASDHDRHHAFRLGRTAWGVQFHPEFDADIVRALTRARAKGLRADGLCPEAILAAVEETPHAASVLARFGRIAAARASPSGALWACP
jgi:GMP synthase (glutamine-hydrolysing)